MDYQRLKGRVRLTALFLAASFSTDLLATTSEGKKSSSVTSDATVNTSDDERNESVQNLSGKFSPKSSPKRKKDWSNLPPSPMVTRLDERLALSAAKEAQEDWDSWQLSPALPSKKDSSKPTAKTRGIRAMNLSADGNPEEVPEDSNGNVSENPNETLDQDKISQSEVDDIGSADGESDNDQVDNRESDEETDDYFLPAEPESERDNEPEALPPVADYPRTPRSKKYDATVSPIKRSTPFKGTLNVPLSINELPTDNFVCCVIETPEVLMTRKEKMINESLPVQLYSFNPENKQIHRSQDELLAILYLWFKKNEVKEALEEAGDQRVLSVNSSDLIDFIIEFPWNQRFTPLPDFLAYVAKKTKRSVLFIDVGNSPIRCSMDIIKRIIFIEYDSDLGNVGAVFDKTPRLSDKELIQAVKVCDRDTFVIIKNTAHKRYLFSLPFEDDIPVLDLLQKPEAMVDPIQHIWHQEAMRKTKNMVAPVVALGLTGLGTYKGWPTFTSACSAAYSKAKEVAFIKRCLTFLHLIH